MQNKCLNFKVPICFMKQYFYVLEKHIIVLRSQKKPKMPF